MRLRRCVLLLLLLLVGVFSVTRVSYADVTDRWTEHPYVKVSQWNDTVDSEVCESIPPAGEVLACGSGYDAAAWCLGTDPRTLTDLQRAYLSDAEFCPAFCNYANSFVCTWPSVNIAGIAQTGYEYKSTGYSNAQFDLAREQFTDILAGNYPNVDSDASLLSIHPNYGNDANTTRYYSDGLNKYGVSYKFTDQYNALDSNLLYPDGGSLYIPEDMFNGYPDDGDWDLFVTVNGMTGHNPLYYRFYLLPRDNYTITYADPINSSYFPDGTKRIDGIDVNAPYYTAGSSYALNAGFSNGSLTLNNTDSTIRLTLQNYSHQYLSTTYDLLVCFGNAGGTVSDPVGDWPDSPKVEPTPEPDPPTPPDPDIPIPDPPELPEPDDPIVVSEPTEYTDYVPWLRAILAALNAINQSLSEHCYHIRTQIVSSTNWLYDAIEILLTTLFDALNDYLYELITWLVEVLKRAVVGAPVTIGDTVVNVDTNSIVTLLKAILLKLDELVPSSDPLQGFWDLLNSILTGIVAALVSGALGLLGGMASAVEGLASKFPFSLPWDLITIVGLFAHDPVTPVFDLPLALPNGGLGSVHVDLSDWDTVMVSVRAVQMALFGYGLARKTPDVVQMLDSIFVG